MFPYSFPFESLAPVVVGRWHIDYGILHFSHKHNYDVVDLTLIPSAHQGTDSAGNYRSRMTEDNHLYNFQFFDSNDKSSGLLTSNYFVVCYYLFYNSSMYETVSSNE